MDATQNVSDIICQNKLFDVVASQRKCVHRRPLCPPFPSSPRSPDPACLMTPSVVCPAQLQFCLSLLPLSTPLLTPSLPVSLFCCVCLQTTTNCCLMHDRLMPPAPWPHATCHLPYLPYLPHLPHACPARCLSLLSRLASSALPKSSSFAASSALCAPSHVPPCHRLTASCRPLGHCLRHTLASKLINLLQPPPPPAIAVHLKIFPSYRARIELQF